MTLQPSGNTCVPSSLDMLLDGLAPGRAGTRIGEYVGKLGPRGLTSADAMAFIDDNLGMVGATFVRGYLPAALASGRPFIAFVRSGADGHAVLVHEVFDLNGVR